MSINIRIPATPETYSAIKIENLTNRHVKMGVKVQLDILLLYLMMGFIQCSMYAIRCRDGYNGKGSKRIMTTEKKKKDDDGVL